MAILDSIVRDIMSSRRFELLLKFLHLNEIHGSSQPAVEWVMTSCTRSALYSMQ